VRLSLPFFPASDLKHLHAALQNVGQCLETHPGNDSSECPSRKVGAAHPVLTVTFCLVTAADIERSGKPDARSGKLPILASNLGYGTRSGNLPSGLIREVEANYRIAQGSHGPPQRGLIPSPSLSRWREHNRVSVREL
jgi:hypothetical protein